MKRKCRKKIIVSNCVKVNDCGPFFALPEVQASYEGELTYKLALAIIYSTGHVLSRVRVDGGGAEVGKGIRCLPKKTVKK